MTCRNSLGKRTSLYITIMVGNDCVECGLECTHARTAGFCVLIPFLSRPWFCCECSSRHIHPRSRPAVLCIPGEGNGRQPHFIFNMAYRIAGNFGGKHFVVFVVESLSTEYFILPTNEAIIDHL